MNNEMTRERQWKGRKGRISEKKTWETGHLRTEVGSPMMMTYSAPWWWGNNGHGRRWGSRSEDEGDLSQHPF
jgi:hypothetical protein